MLSRKTDEAMSVARDIGTLLRKEGVPVRRLFLFGSHAQGKQHQWSDIDVAVVHDAFLPTRGKEKSLLFEKGKTVHVRVELLSFRPEDLENRYSAIAQEVQRTGIAVSDA